MKKALIGTGGATSKDCENAVLVDLCLICDFLCKVMVVVLNDAYMMISTLTIHSIDLHTEGIYPQILNPE
jgi:hypothetical protein